MNILLLSIAPTFSDRVIGFLLQKLEVSNEKPRTASLAIIKHLVNSSGEFKMLTKCCLWQLFFLINSEMNVDLCYLYFTHAVNAL